ncbi:MAG: hypothetical protein RQ733_09225 [Methyloprofundus sp.]|nr:hypothetical protein [Methyloprofundus sp.]MDT8426141.1 hypothetical protein [Methyloprofundus sp.]
MSDCCAKKSSIISAHECPECHQYCKNISLKTIYHHVKFSENQAILAGDYYFCANKSCAVAYFLATGSLFPKRLLISAQAIEEDRLCYCFDISEAEYRAALEDGSAEMIKNFVIAQTKMALCACEVRNPSGQCCLATFKRLEKDARR